MIRSVESHNGNINKIMWEHRGRASKSDCWAGKASRRKCYLNGAFKKEGYSDPGKERGGSIRFKETGCGRAPGTEGHCVFGQCGFHVATADYIWQYGARKVEF